MLRNLSTLSLLLFLTACHPNSNTTKTTISDTELIHTLNNQLTETILQDGFSPPVASRIYTYSNIAAYEAIRPLDPNLVSLKNQLNGFDSLPESSPNNQANYQLSLIEAFCNVAVYTVYRGYLMDDLKTKLEAEFNKTLDQKTYDASIQYGKQISTAVINWAKKDRYAQTRKMPFFVTGKNPGAWESTPPKYGEAIEPHWDKIRPFVLDSAAQFLPPPPIAFSTDKNSDFYKMVMVVYQTTNQLDTQQKQTAKFWDCNPMLSIQKGHLTYLQRQLTPGGHWMGITRIAARMKHLSLPQTCEIYTRVAIGLADGFISIWKTKYTYDLIRPETYINRYIDPHWRPFLETPLFPEYTSGHSGVSAASATILTNYFGDNFAFTDSAEVNYSTLPNRTYTSFYQAAAEANISRLYGGIHFRPSLDIAAEQGKKVGALINQKIKTHR